MHYWLAHLMQTISRTTFPDVRMAARMDSMISQKSRYRGLHAVDSVDVKEPLSMAKGC